MIDLITQLQVTSMCGLASHILDNTEAMMAENDNNLDNCGTMDQAKDIERANKKILEHIDSLRGKQRVVTPAQISKELGMSEEFIESILIANGFGVD